MVAADHRQAVSSVAAMALPLHAPCVLAGGAGGSPFHAQRHEKTH